MPLPAPRPIDEFHKVDRDAFLADIRPRGLPAVLRGLAADWPAVRAATTSRTAIVDYLEDCTPTRPVTAIIGRPEIGGRFFYDDEVRGLNFERGQCTLGDFLHRLLRDQNDPAPHAMAVQSEVIPDLMPRFTEDNRIDLLDTRVAPRIWLGNAIRVATHYDLKENIGVVVAGRRRFTVFPPDQADNLYPGPLEVTPAGTPVSMVDPAAPDLVRYPRFAAAAATAQSAELMPGDAIYLPFHWWHAVDSLDPVSILVNYWWNDAPAGIGNPYDVLMHALYTLKPLPPEQRAVWRAMFDRYIFRDEDPVAHLPDHAKGVLGTQTADVRGRMRATLKQIFKHL